LRPARRRDGQEGAHLAPLHEAAVVDGGRDARVLHRDGAAALGELLRPEMVGRRVLEVAGAVHRRRDDGGTLAGAALAVEEGDRVEPGRPLPGRTAAEPVEAVVAQHSALDEAAAGELA